MYIGVKNLTYSIRWSKEKKKNMYTSVKEETWKFEKNKSKNDKKEKKCISSKIKYTYVNKKKKIKRVKIKKRKKRHAVELWLYYV